jgi:hypothetical protein
MFFSYVALTNTKPIKETIDSMFDQEAGLLSIYSQSSSSPGAGPTKLCQNESMYPAKNLSTPAPKYLRI